MAQWLPERFGDGRDGTLTISASTSETPIDSSCSGSSGTTSLTATNASFATGQIIYIHQSRGTGVGQWELNVISSYTAGTITTKYNLAYTYADSGASQAQVRVLKQYSSVTIESGQTYTAKGRSGSVGSIIGWMCNGTTTVTGTIAHVGGFTGSVGANIAVTAGSQGEGNAGAGATDTTTANGTGGGGGVHGHTGIHDASGGGGGGYAVAGDIGQDKGGGLNEGGGTAGLANLTTMIFGGAGGGGGCRESGKTGGTGGDSGAIFAFFTENIVITGLINNNGKNGNNATGDGAGGGGGGSGGAVLIKCNTATLGTNLITVAGGTYGNGQAGGGYGGNGGAGRIHLSYLTSYTGSTTPALDVLQDTEMTSTSTSTTISTTTTTTRSTSTSSTTTSSSTTLTTSTTQSTSTSSTTTSSSISTTTTRSTSTSSTTTSSSISTSTTTTTTILSIGGLDFKRKRFEYRVFDGSTFKASWTDEVINEPRFRNSINSGPGELIIRLARSFDSFGEDDDVKLNNRVDLWVYDRQMPNGKQIYRGFISGYRPMLDGNKEYVEITALNYVFELSRYMLEDGSGNTKIAYNSYDPSDILRDAIVKYRAQGGTLNYTPTSIQDTNTTVSYTFNTNTVREVVDKCVELAPEGWYWTVGTDSIIYFKPREAIASHKFQIGRHISKMETFRRIEDVVNKVYFTGFTTASGTGLYRKYSNTGSISSYGMHAITMTDGRVTQNSTADTMANRMINNKKDPEIRTILTVLDNNGIYQYKGYDIESVLPGETMQILNIKQGVKTTSLWDVMLWDVDLWDSTLSYAAAAVIQIMSIDYTPDLLNIEATSRLPDISKRIEDIDRNLTAIQTVDNPTVPVAG